MLMLFPSALTENPVREVATLWRAALAGVRHPAACACMGGALAPILRPEDLEEDLLFYLASRPGGGGVADAIAARQAAPDGSTFPLWLADLVGLLPRQEAAALLDDVRMSLASLASPGFACV